MAYIGVSPSNGVRRVHTYTATASQTTFSGAGAEGTSLSYKDSNFVDVYQNGIKLGDADYTSTSGTSIVLAQGASVNDLVVVVVFDVFSVADTVSKADGGTFDGNVTMGGTLDVSGAFTSLGIDDNASSTAVTVSTGGFTLSPATNNLYLADGTLSYYGTDNNVYLNGAGSGGGLLLSGDGTRAENIDIDASENNIKFTVGTAQRMQIDSSKVSVGGSTSSKTSTGTIEIKGTSANQSIITNSDQSASYINNATLTFGSRSGILIVNNHGTGSVELFAMGGGAVSRFAGSSTTSGAVTYSSPNYVWTNDEGATYTFTHTFIQTRNNV